MKTKKVFICFIVFGFVITGCSNTEENNIEKAPNAEEILSQESDADIFMFNDVIYQYGVDWVEELKLSTGEKIGEITDSAEEGDLNYTNGMANKLPLGSVIYEVEEKVADENDINEDFNDILIVEDNGDQKYYLASTEG